jgi:hypothetical protein
MKRRVGRKAIRARALPLADMAAWSRITMFGDGKIDMGKLVSIIRVKRSSDWSSLCAIDSTV